MTTRFRPEDVDTVLLDADLTLYPQGAAYLKACVKAVDAVRVGVSGFLKKRLLRGLVAQHGLHHTADIPKGQGLGGILMQARQQLNADFIQPNTPLIDVFEAMAADSAQGVPLTVFVLSHADKPWALQVVARAGVAPFVPAAQVLTPETYPGLNKSLPWVYETLAKNKQLSPLSRTLLIDDDLANLRAAHQAGLQTAWVVSAARAVLETPDYVGLVVTNPAQALKRVQAARQMAAV